MSSAAYFPILVQICLAIALTAGVILTSQLLGQRARRNAIKDSPYECGVKSDGNPHTRFSVKFYVTVMLFILFDIEVVFLIPWAFIYRDFLANNIEIVAPILVFIGVIVLGLFYEVKKGALKWEK
ncbi:NADH-quinone oxidoreductase subunit A [Ereboglobus luteus]|uniref:NADH-quinone oxidoreductase subunit A n=1 Tax=Ereboglobus luteus TaxID=1796921 RepID=A0A2U8E5L7_9BACT|nr:NADH-quinone oxidoreductase subunit A [Ereboglobus luteus]AWI10126.1 NADH-quinone oxidoreductase subunit I [Ereboglobus luteus]